ncbi:MAG: hypothetical protein A2314_01385, partial [Elusimicrobia bacterium RIFOXYB2_FULL_50_12]
MENNMANANSPYFFVLDIGTRFVRGLVCERHKGDGAPLVIAACEIREHQTRAMRAGQIHDIEKVTAIVTEIKRSLEDRYGALAKVAVAVAVAGRNLLTCRGRARIARQSPEPINAAEVKQLELMAVQKALEGITGAADDYFCVGYSVVGYRIDNEELATLLDHRGSLIEAEALVTLLPRQVLEAMFTVTKKCGLEIEYLTLEPIAALEATVSEHLVPLNIALIDIGAGTADIAIVSQGKVQAYGMVPVAGDMVTEAICNAWVVGFDEAERLKRNLGIWQQEARVREDSVITFKDIFNREQSRQLSEALDSVRSAAREMAARIGDEIKRLVPASGANMDRCAAILVGGGSMTPFVEEEIAAALGLDRGRIGLRPAALNDAIDDRSGKLGGPDAATAAGIGLLFSRRPGLTLTHLALNDKRVTFMSTERNPTVLSMLLSQGITVRQIYGRPGLAITFTLNGRLESVKGEAPLPATIEVNGVKAALDAPVRAGDRIIFYPAKDGRDAACSVGELEAAELPRARLNGREVPLPAQITLNGEPAGMETPIPDRAVVACLPDRSLGAMIENHFPSMPQPGERHIRIEVDGEEIAVKEKNYFLQVNGGEREFDAQLALRDNDEVAFGYLEPKFKVANFVSSAPKGRPLRVRINGEE